MKMKWDLNGKGVAPTGGGGGNYSGPPLPKGSWPCKIKRITVGSIKNGANAGKPRLSILLEVQTAGIEGKEQYNGAPVWDGLNIIKSGIGYTNAFLHALTDGSESAKRAIESAFWDADKGPDVKKTTNKSGVEETHIVKIGKVKIDSPNGEMMVQITSKVEKDLNGNDRPAVAAYMPHKSTIAAAKNVEPEDDLDDDDDDDGVSVDDFDEDDDALDFDDDEVSSAKPF